MHTKGETPAEVLGSINISVYQNLCNPSLASNFWLTNFTEYNFALSLHYILCKR